jgi:hypothetical protein
MFTGVALVAASLTGATAGSLAVGAAAAPPSSAAPSSCQLGPNGQTKHVIYIEFDNTHFMRDIGRDGSTNVPSDLEQMPNLLSFLEGNGTLLSNHHTQLISHTSDDITTSITGVYPDRHGVATAANSYQIYSSDYKTTKFQSGFTYWTSKATDGQYNFTSAPNTNAPAPWVPYTRAGCDVGAAAMTGFVAENSTDLTNLFGDKSPPTTDPNGFADYEGVAVHCAAGNALCSSANGGVADVLPDEPNADGSKPAAPGAGYQGYNALYGHKSLTQALRNMPTPGTVLDANGNLKDINGNTIVDDFNGSLTPGFPGFSLAPQYSLGYVADMQESGIPVTMAYIITPHRPLPANPYGYGHQGSNDYGPGEANYVDQLRQYDAAFGAFFTRLANDGINKSNTLFVVTSEEGDHFVGGAPSPSGCDGVTVPCTYSQTGEVTTDYKGLMQGEQGANLPPTSPPATSVTVTNDDAPDLYLTNNPPPSDPVTRAYERATGALTVTSPISQNVDQLTQDMANPAEFNILHMLTADPLRNPTFTAFANPDYFVGPAVSGCAGSTTPSTDCVMESPAFAWNHGDVQPQITTTWVGFIGPGVRARGLDGPGPTAEARGVRFGTFSDHTDIRPTMLQLLGLHDDYASDGRVLVEDMANSALPPALRSGSPGRAAYIQLAQLYKQLNAPVGAFGLATLQLSTQALESNSPGDSAYNNLEQLLVALGHSRDTIVAGLRQDLDGAFGQNAQPLISSKAAGLSGQGQHLVGQISALTRQ